MVSVSVLVALFKRSTVPTFKSYGIVQARISDCASETFSAIRTVRTFGGEKRQISFFDNLARAYQNSGTKLGVLKSANESLTRVVVYVSLLALYILGGSKVNAVSHRTAWIYNICITLFIHVVHSFVMLWKVLYHSK